MINERNARTNNSTDLKLNGTSKTSVSENKKDNDEVSLGKDDDSKNTNSIN
jgi:hypothetical protein